ncbi:MAG: hypothetical protein HFH97_05420 [Lachnospiraceae bacterium]|nr:hypothetical protein [Lachnospiraceae bacterium]
MDRTRTERAGYGGKVGAKTEELRKAADRGEILGRTVWNPPGMQRLQDSTFYDKISDM